MFEEHEGIRYLEIRERGPKKLVLSTASISENISKQSDSNNRNIYFAHRSIHEPHHSPFMYNENATVLGFVEPHNCVLIIPLKVAVQLLGPHSWWLLL